MEPYQGGTAVTARRGTRPQNHAAEASVSHLLQAQELTVTYQGGVRAVQGIDVTVERGQIVALVGRNGAGKTSILRAIAGFLRGEHVKVGGHLSYEGERVSSGLAFRGGRGEAVFVPERDKVFSRLSIEDHWKLAGLPPGEMDGLFAMFPRLAERRSVRSGVLSGGERQMLAIGTALARGPKLLLVDELSLGLARGLALELGQVLRRTVTERQMGVLIVEQSAHLAEGLADFSYFLEHGVVVRSGPSRQAEAAAT